MNEKFDSSETRKIFDLFNSLTHGDPVAANWNLVQLSDGGLGYSVGKVINDPKLCDFICFPVLLLPDSVNGYDGSMFSRFIEAFIL